MNTPTPTQTKHIDTVKVDRGTLADGTPAFVAYDTAYDGLMAQASTAAGARAALEALRPEYLAALDPARSGPALHLARVASDLTLAVKTFFFGFDQAPTTRSSYSIEVSQS